MENKGKAFAVNKLRKYVRIFGAPAPKTGLSAPIFFAADSKKGFPLQSHCAIGSSEPNTALATGNCGGA
jgi:hypothetical protein